MITIILLALFSGVSAGEALFRKLNPPAYEVDGQRYERVRDLLWACHYEPV